MCFLFAHICICSNKKCIIVPSPRPSVHSSICSHVPSRQPLNRFKPDLEGWFPMILPPVVLVLSWRTARRLFLLLTGSFTDVTSQKLFFTGALRVGKSKGIFTFAYLHIQSSNRAGLNYAGLFPWIQEIFQFQLCLRYPLLTISSDFCGFIAPRVRLPLFVPFFARQLAFHM